MKTKTAEIVSLKEKSRKAKNLRILKLILIVLGEILGGGLLSFVYVYLLAYFTNAVLRVMVIVGVVSGASAWMVCLLRWGQIREPKWQRILIAVQGIILYYSKWVLYTNLVEDAWFIGMERLWEYHFTLPDFFYRWGERCLQPQLIVQMMGEILYRGFLSINGQVLKGSLLGAVWVLEAMVLMGFPFLLVRSRMKVPYDRKAKVWLNSEEERVVTYVKDYRDIRRKMHERGPLAIRAALSELDAFHPEGKESYGILTFYRKGSHIGPYISLVNVRAVQVGPRRIQRQYVQIGERIEIGSEEAEALYGRLFQASFGDGCTALPNWHQDLWSRIIAMAVEFRTKIVNLFKKEKDSQKEEEEVKVYEGSEEAFNLEDITVFVPKITPEMEKEYRKKKKK